jgi:lantibiotic modifying enzyme
MEFADGSWRVVQRALGGDFYGGTSGIALFLARMYAVTGEGLFRATAIGAMEQALSRAESIRPEGRIGFYSGVTGISFAAVLSGQLCDHSQLASGGIAALERLQDDNVDHQELDVVSGSAGAIPVLLSLHEKLERDFLLDLAVRHGDHLIDVAHRREAGWSWDTLHLNSGHDLTGYSHGTSGVALALLELAAKTGIERYRNAAHCGFDYERSHYNPEFENWPDFRPLNEQPGAVPGYGIAWCHGAPGIGLARLRAYQLDTDVAWREQAEAALRTTGKHLRPEAGGSQNYSLCHGLAGNSELPLYASMVLGDERLRRQAEDVGRYGIETYLRTRTAWPCGVIGGGETPSLMLGLAGIGYFYLRLHDPEGVPSVLIVSPGPPPPGPTRKHQGRSQNDVIGSTNNSVECTDKPAREAPHGMQ